MNTDSCEMRRYEPVDGGYLAIKDRPPGSFSIEKDDGDDGVVAHIWAKLPSGGICGLPVGLKGKPPQTVGGATWEWDGNKERPTLAPSIWFNKNRGGEREWHGFIRNGRMESC